MNWISVEDRLPEHHQTVLASTLKGMVITVFLDTKEVIKVLNKNGFPGSSLADKPYAFCSQEKQGNILNGVTHWMPLPEPPEE